MPEYGDYCCQDLETENLQVSTNIADIKVATGASFSVDLNVFTDAINGESVEVRVDLSDGSSKPAWMNFNQNTKMLSGTASGGQGQWHVRVFA